MANSFFSSSVNGVVGIEEASLGIGGGLSMAMCAIGFALSLSLGAEKTDAYVEDGVLVAAAIALNFLKIPLGPTGGSINLQMLPLMVIALRHGPFHGLLCGGIIFGLITCLSDGYGFACYPFDYLVAFGGIGVLGFFQALILPKEETPIWKSELFLALGGVLVTLIRFIGSSASSMILWNCTLLKAVLYNVTYIPASGLVSTLLLMALLPTLKRIDRLFPVKAKS